MADVWRIKLASSGVWTNLWVTSFDEKDQQEVSEFGLQGRTTTGVSVGRQGGMKGTIEMLVRDAAEDSALMGILKSRAKLDLNDPLGREWVVRVTSDVSRNQNIAPQSSGPYKIKHEFFIECKVVEVANT